MDLTAGNGVGRPFNQIFVLNLVDPSQPKSKPRNPDSAKSVPLTTQAPAFTSASSTIFTVNVSGTFSVKATGSPVPTISESGTLPLEVKFKPKSGTGTLSGIPAAGTGGSYVLTFTASNGVGNAAIQTFTLKVDQLPVITSANAASFTVQTHGSFLITASGYPAAALSESGSLPSGVTFLDNGNGTATLSGTTSVKAKYSITVTANNGVGSPATQPFTLTVQALPKCTLTWNGDSSDNWATASNWAPARAPTTTDWACVPAGTPNLPVQLSGTSTIKGITNGGAISVTGSLSLSTASQPSSSTGSLTLQGTLSVAGPLGISGHLSASGDLAGTGVTTISPSGSLDLFSLNVDGGTLVNEGSGTAEASSGMYVAAGATFTNQGSLTLDSSSYVYGGCAIAATPTSSAVPAGVMNSTGSITSTATSGFPASIGYPYNNYCLVFNDSGPITIASNELDLGGATSLNSGASITGPSSTTLGVEYGSVTLNSGASISGPGTIDGNGTLVLNTNLTALAVHVSTVSGPGNLTVTSDLDVSNLEGPGTVTATSAATFESSSLNVDGGTLVNEGSGTAEANSGMYVAAGATFTNQGSLTLDSSSYVYGGCAIAATPTSSAVPAGVMNSTGSITSTATSGFPASIGYPYNNYCLVFNDSGPITIASNELDLGGATSLNSGASITGPSSTTLGVEYGSVTLNSGASISGPGTIDGNGTLVLNTNLTALAVHVSTVSGPGNLTVTSDLDVSNLEGPGGVTVASGATFESSSLNVDGGTLVNEGSGTAEASLGYVCGGWGHFHQSGFVDLGLVELRLRWLRHCGDADVVGCARRCDEQHWVDHLDGHVWFPGVDRLPV